MLKFKTSCAVLTYLSSNLLNEVGLSLFRYFEVGLRVCDIVVKKLTFAISFPDEFLFITSYKNLPTTLEVGIVSSYHNFVVTVYARHFFCDSSASRYIHCGA